MADIKYAHALVRGDRINLSAALDAALGETGEHFFLDNVDPNDPATADAAVEGVESAHGGSTVYTDAGAFTVPEHFPIHINAYAEDL